MMTVSLPSTLDRYIDTFGVSNWKEVVHNAIHRLIVSQELMKELLASLDSSVIQDEESYILFCQKALILALIHKSHPAEKQRELLGAIYLKVVKHQSFKEKQRPALYKALLAFILGYSLDLVNVHVIEPGIAFREYGGHDQGLHLPHLIESVECAILMLLLAHFLSDESLAKKALSISAWHHSLFDSNLELPQGLWMEEKDYNKALQMFLHAALFSAVHEITGDEKMLSSSHKLFSLFDAGILKESSLFSSLYPLLHFTLMEEIQNSPWKGDIQVPLVSRHALKSLGFASYECKDLSCYMTASGNYSGFGGIKKQGVEIVSMGPQYLPLGDMDKYGIYRTPLLQQNPFKDVKVQQSDHSFVFDGWTKIVPPQRSSVLSSWMQLQLSALEGSLTLKVKWVEERSSQDLYIAFFVKASKAIVDRNYHLSPHTLDHYQGSAATIDFGQLCIKTNSIHPMQVRPLAGGAHFWGAQFLLAYQLPKDVEIIFEIA